MTAATSRIIDAEPQRVKIREHPPSWRPEAAESFGFTRLLGSGVLTVYGSTELRCTCYSTKSEKLKTEELQRLAAPVGCKRMGSELRYWTLTDRG